MILTRSPMIIKKAKYKKVSKCQNLKRRQRKYINFGLVLSKFTKEFIEVHWLGKKLPMDLKNIDVWFMGDIFFKTEKKLVLLHFITTTKAVW